MAGPAEILPAVAGLAGDPRNGAVMLDLDGTLAPIVARPEDSAVPWRTRDLVAQIASRYGLTAVVSGRQALEARRILGLDQIVYVGNHGYEVLAPHAEAPVPAPALAGHERDAADFLGAFGTDALRETGVRIEDKSAIVALHWRGAADEVAAESAAELAAAEAEAASLVVHRGRKVLELRPSVRTDKGRAIEGLLAGAAFLTAALYAGDDRTDLDAFAVLRRLQSDGRLRHAVCVGVAAPEAPPEVALSADIAVAGPDAFVTVLEALG